MRFEDVTETAGVTTHTLGHRRHHGGHQQRRRPRHLRLGLRPRMVHAGPAGQPALRQRRERATSPSAPRSTASPTTGFTTHAAFLDYDGDGCLDLFVLNNSPSDFTRGDVASMPVGNPGQDAGQLSTTSIATTATATSPTCPSRRASCRKPGYGLGVVVSDLNGDGWPDIYVSNDVITNDVVYVNNGNGTFTDKAARLVQARQLRRHGRRHRRLQQRRLARHHAGRHDAAHAGPPEAHDAATRPTPACSSARSRGYARRLLRQLAPAQQRRHQRRGPRLQRDRPHRRRRAHRLELERAVRRLRQRRPQGHLHRQRLSEGRERSRLHDHARRAP